MRYGIAALLIGLFCWGAMMNGAEPNPDELIKKANQQFREGNYKEALSSYKKLLLDSPASPQQLTTAFNQAISSQQQLGLDEEFDTLAEAVVKARPQIWQVLEVVAERYLNAQHYGTIVEGEFVRGYRRNRNGAENANAMDRDRVRALQLLTQAMPLMEDEEPKARGEFYLQLATAIIYNRYGNTQSWELQTLTDLNSLPDYATGYRYSSGNSTTSGAPVDENGDPILHKLPESWENASSDGERWRWALQQASTTNPQLTNQVQMQWGNFLLNQFGVQTMSGVIGRANEDLDDKTGPFAVRSLKENETIARLATGIKRFELPEEFHFIAVFQKVVNDKDRGQVEQALAQLSSIFENRQQYSTAVEYRQQSLKEFGDNRYKSKAKHISQIVDPWGRFEGTQIQPAGEVFSIPFRFRNGELLSLTAKEINHRRLVADVKTYLKTRPQQIDGNKLNLGNIGYRIVQQNEKKYVGEEVANWQVKLNPREDHLDRRIDVEVPVKKAGAYLIEATLKNGNTSRIIVWLDDLAIVRKPLNYKEWYFIADAKTGEPVPNTHVQFFGYSVQRPKPKTTNYSFSEFAEKSDKQGQFEVSDKLKDADKTWLTVASAPNGRFAYLGFDRLWYGDYERMDYRSSKAFIITDRPVYRPGQSVKFKFWLREASFEDRDLNRFANQNFSMTIANPRSEKLLEKQFETDEYGGFHGEIELEETAALGQYSIYLNGGQKVSGNNSFRVEEYKKPEYEVTIESPEKPIALGEPISAKIQAKYFFGAPVTNATVKYKVERTNHSANWYPATRWDWLYGNGYWWFSSNYDWYPGWHRWGCWAPTPSWWHMPSDPPELVLENEVPIGPDGTVDVTIETALAKAIHGDSDHKYSITAEVVDESRRTIVGTGSVLAARDPFKVFVWVNRGYYRVGDVIEASMKAQTLDRKPIQGTGQLTLYSITYDEQGEPQEKQVDQWELNTAADGTASQKIKANQPGQYRLAYKVTDDENHTQEGAYIFLVRGEKGTTEGFRFDDLEVIPDKKTYQPGETVKLMINTERKDSTVLLFVRPSNGTYLPPQTLRLDGQSQVVDLKVEAGDMPNFFVEAMTLSDAQVFEQVRNVVVPPEKRIINVKVEPDAERYLPGKEAKVNITLTDQDDKPITGSVVLTAYDRSVEYISGGSNVPEIRDFYWKFQRSHRPQHTSSLQRYFGNLLKRNEETLQSLGVFGDIEILTKSELQNKNNFGVFNRRGLNSRMLRSHTIYNSTSRMEMDRAMPMSAPAMEGAPMEKMSLAVGGGSGGGLGSMQSTPEPEMVQPTIRKEFADTAYWNATITPDESGKATVTFPMPENLTEWKLKAWSMGDGTRVGEGEASVVTSKDVLVRLQAPRFFVEKDEVVISANVHNYLKEAKSTRVELVLEGNTLEPLGDLQTTVDIEANGEQRVDWRVKATAEGEAVITVKALTDADSDAMQMKFPVYVHGMLKTESFTGVVRSEEGEGAFQITVPAERRPEQSELVIRYSPTLAGAMVDALPYLLEYPYGCTEQTLNRFLPAVITQNILQDAGLNLEEIQQKLTNLNAQELGDGSERAKKWQRFDSSPVYSTSKMQDIVKVGVKRLTDMQLSDGGWGWFSGFGEQSYPHTTATVVHGLQVAQANDIALTEGMLQRGIDWLKNYQERQVELLKKGDEEKPEFPYRKSAGNLDAFVYMVLIDANVANAEMLEYLYRDRTNLSVYSMAMFGLALHKQQLQEKLDMILSNIDQFLVTDEENETAYLKIPENFGWWYWYGNDIEANAYYLKLLAKTDPKGERAPRLVKYLLNNRKHATYWNSTRDTALCIEAMSDYLTASGEAQPNYTLEILVDGEVKKTVEINAENLFSFDGTLTLSGEDVTSGEHQIAFRKKGEGPVYWNAYLTNFTLEDPITAAGLELKVRRNVYKLVRREDAAANVAGSSGQVVKENRELFDRVELKTGDKVESGDLLEIELGIDSKNDYEYVILEDFKAAGTEPVNVQSGYLRSANGAYVEFRDEKVAFFFRTIDRGTNSMSYRLRAEIPGTFSALPTFSYAMYAPELKANSDEFKLRIEE